MRRNLSIKEITARIPNKRIYKRLPIKRFNLGYSRLIRIPSSLSELLSLRAKGTSHKPAKLPKLNLETWGVINHAIRVTKGLKSSMKALRKRTKSQILYILRMKYGMFRMRMRFFNKKVKKSKHDQNLREILKIMSNHILALSKMWYLLIYLVSWGQFSVG